MDGVVEKITVPDIGDFDEVDVVEVLVTGGDTVAVEDPLITLESDKATMDVPSPLAGKVVDVKVRAGDKVATGAVILTLAVDQRVEEPVEPGGSESLPGGGPTQRPAPTSAGTESTDRQPGPEDLKRSVSSPAELPTASIGPAPIDEFPTTGVYASPAVRRFARQASSLQQHFQHRGYNSAWTNSANIHNFL